MDDDFAVLVDGVGVGDYAECLELRVECSRKAESFIVLHVLLST